MRFIITEEQKDKVHSLIYNFINDTYNDPDFDWGYAVDDINDGGNSDEMGETFFNFVDDKYFTFLDCNYVKNHFYDIDTPCPYIALGDPRESYFNNFFGSHWKEPFLRWFEDMSGIKALSVGD